MRTIAFTVLAASTLPAQRIPDPVDNRLEIQVHDVRAVLDAVGFQHALAIAAFEEEPEGALELHRRDRMQDLVALARAFVQPSLPDPTALQPLGSDLLVLRGGPEQHVSLQGILRALSRWEDEAITIDCQVVKVPQKAFAADIAPLLGLKELGGGGGTVARVQLEDEPGARLVVALKGIEGCEIVQSPRLTVLPAQEGSLSILNTILYRQDYEVEVKGKEIVVWPITGKLKDGVVLELRAAPIAEKTLGVSVHGSLSEVQRPIPTFETVIGVEGKKVTVDLPQVTARQFDADLRLGDRDLGVIVSGTAEDPARLLLLVRASVH